MKKLLDKWALRWLQHRGIATHTEVRPNKAQCLGATLSLSLYDAKHFPYGNPSVFMMEKLTNMLVKDIVPYIKFEEEVQACELNTLYKATLWVLPPWSC